MSKCSTTRYILKEIFYLMMHSIHLIYSYMASDKWYRTIHIERKHCCHIGYSFCFAVMYFFIYTIPDMIVHSTAFVTPIIDYWLQQEIAQWSTRYIENKAVWICYSPPPYPSPPPINFLDPPLQSILRTNYN